MDKRKLIAQVAKRSGYAKWEVTKIADLLMEETLEMLQQGERVHLKGLGKFELRVRKARNVIHPKTKQPVTIPEKVTVAFDVSEKFKLQEEVIETIRLKVKRPSNNEARRQSSKN